MDTPIFRVFLSSIGVSMAALVQGVVRFVIMLTGEIC